MAVLGLTTTLAAGAGCNGDTKGLAEVYDTATTDDDHCDPDATYPPSSITQQGSWPYLTCIVEYGFPEACNDQIKLHGVYFYGGNDIGYTDGGGTATAHFPEPYCDPAGSGVDAWVHPETDGAGGFTMGTATTLECLPDDVVGRERDEPLCNDVPSGDVVTVTFELDDHDCQIDLNDPECVPYTCEEALGDMEIGYVFDDAADCVGSSSFTASNPVCTPRTNVPMSLEYAYVRDNDRDGEQHAIIFPVLESGSGYSERAWLRKVVVTDWGDASAFHIQGFDHPFEVSADDVVDTTHSVTLDAGNTPKTYAVGDITMSTTWAIDGLPGHLATYKLPELKVDWSCEVDTEDPHFVVDANAAAAFAAPISDLTGVTASQRILLRFPSSSEATIELEGRYNDRVTLQLTPVSPGVHSFDEQTTANHGFHVAGTVTQVGSDKQVDLTDLTLRGVDFGAATLTFTPL